MAIEVDQYPDEKSDFASMRDSLYILSVMNQYTIERTMPAQEGEKLLRIALFSDSLLIRSGHVSIKTFKEGRQVLASTLRKTRKRRKFLANTLWETLGKRRQSLASTLRETRKRGVVPVYISLGWFLFSLALSIEDAFGQLGDNQTAHNLALGLLLAWLPVFLIATIVDRNPVGTERNRRILNEFLEEVRSALLDPAARKPFLATSKRSVADLALTGVLRNNDTYHDGFFTHYAGQGRVRWHYGVAHPILAAMERCYVTVIGRGWLADPDAARSAIIWSPVREQGLIWFDPRMIWQISSSLVVVGGTIFGAFILSCRFYAPFTRNPRESLDG
ncbi:MAG: hypothetical protein LQ338_000385 [Usnochroma carphineum]|nr:MAG: hypothetical protein LQ338_000385 [Usnochroma carphineum]